MDGLIMAGQLLLGLSILITLHELGHYMAARAFGIRVEKFFLFFDPWGKKLFSIKKGDTEYGIGWLPLGGYVKISGMIDESMDKEQMKLPPQPWEYRSKPAWQRLIVMTGGVIMNVLLGILIYWQLVFVNGTSFLPISEAKYGIVAGELAQGLGLKTGDHIVAVNDSPLTRFEEILSSRVLYGNCVLTVLRGEEKLSVKIPADFVEKLADKGKADFVEPRFKFSVGELSKEGGGIKAGLQTGDRITAIDGEPVEFYDQLKTILSKKKNTEIHLSVLRGSDEKNMTVKTNEDGIIGFKPVADLKFEKQDYGFIPALFAGNSLAWGSLTDNLKGFGKILKGEVSATKAIQGPIGIAQIYGSVWDWDRFWSLTALLSMWLAFANILPIPALDGGHVLILLIELVIRRKFSDKAMEKIQIVGMVVLLTLMSFILFNDFWKLILK